MTQQTNIPLDDDDMLPEYDFSKMGKPVRGKYAQRMREEGYSVTVHHEDGTSTTRYVSPEEVQQRQAQREMILGDKIMGDHVAGDKIMGNKITNDLRGTNIANFANEVKDNARQQANQHNYAASQNLTQAAKEITELLNQISSTDTTNNTTLVAMKAIEAIENNPTLKDRIINAGKEAGFAALDAAVDHPAIKIVTAAIKGAIDA